MTYKIIKVNNKSPESNTNSIDLKVSDFISNTPHKSSILGYDGSNMNSLNDTVFKDYNLVYSVDIKQTTWGGSGQVISAGSYVGWRYGSDSTRKIDSTYVSTTYSGSSNSAWASWITLQPGKYILIFSLTQRKHVADVNSRIMNVTDNVGVSNKFKLTGDANPGSAFAYVDIDSAKTFGCTTDNSFILASPAYHSMSGIKIIRVGD